MRLKRAGIIIISVVLAMIFCSANAVKETRYSLTKEMDRIKTPHDSGFSGKEDIGKDDPHYGWGMGSFYIQGYTEVVHDEDGTLVFLKNVGDELILGFDLKQNIKQLRGKKDFIVSEDTNGFDKEFEVEQTNFGRGCLIVVETDYQNRSHKPVIYTDYLAAVQNKTANTKVKPFAEGDYTVTLDYELQSPTGFLGSAVFNDYRIPPFKFKIRNSNCMVFFYKLGKNKDEIANGAVAEEGFKIDFKNSYFLTVNVIKEIMVNNDGVLTLDTRFNKAASDGSAYTEEGLYTITVSNQYTKEQVAKKISVGQNKILNVYAAHNGTMSLNEIAKQLDQGAEINDQWNLILPEAKAEDAYNSKGTEYSGFDRNINTNEQKEESGKKVVTPLNAGIFALVVILLIMVLRAVDKRKRNKGSDTDVISDTSDENTPSALKKPDDSEGNEETEEGKDQ